MKPTRLALLLAAAGFASGAWAADLMGVYKDALVSDPVYQSARAQSGSSRRPSTKMRI